MAAKNYRRIKAGKLGVADLRSGDSLQIIGLEKYYTDIETRVDKYGRPYEKGKTLRAPAVNAILEHYGLSDEKISTASFTMLMRSKGPDTLFTELLSLEKVGQESAVLACIAFLDRLPNLKHIFASTIHRALFVEYGEKNSMNQALQQHRKNMVDTILFEEDARKTAKAMAFELLRSSKLREKPSIDEVVELALTTNVKKNRGWLIDTGLHDAETGVRSLRDANLPVPDYGESSVYRNVCGMTEDQVVAFKGILECDKGVMLLQGMPGSGKSHVITALVSQYMSAGKVPLVTSFMNKACLNLTERMPEYEFSDLYHKRGVPTLHSIYGKLVNSREHRLYKWPLIIVDESSVLSSELLRILMTIHSYSPDTRILFVGDVNQLPPVCAYGTPFHNLMNRGHAATFELKNFHRSNGVGIYELLCKLKSLESGKTLNIESSEDVCLYKGNGIQEACSLATHLSDANKDNIRNLMAIAETNSLKDKLNMAMVCGHLGLNQSDLPTRKSNNEDTVSPIIPGMRVIAKDNIKANNKISGDFARNELGTLVEYSDSHALIHLDIMDRFVEITDSRLYLSNFDVGYASTVHKFQGSEASQVLYCIENYRNLRGNAFFNQKELKYVGLSRAKNKLHIMAIDSAERSGECRKVNELELYTRKVDNAFMCL